MTPDTESPSAAGLGATLRAGLNAGLVVGFVHGLFDGALAGARVGTAGVIDWLGCLALAALVYGLFWAGALMALGLALHAVLRRDALTARYRLLTAVGTGLAVFLELYWWSRPHVLPGRAATDPRRLAASVGLLLAGLALGAGLAWIGRRLPRSARLSLMVLIPLAWIGGTAYKLSANQRDADRGAVNERTRARPNVLLVVVDALRADVLGSYGHPRVKTPHLDALAERGVLFESAIVQAPFTWSSFGSILTGKYPRRHGLVKMAPGVRMRPNITLPWHLKSAAGTNGQPGLQDRDYYGAAFMTGTLSHGSGLARGFDAYYEALVGHDLVTLDDPWSVFRSELLLFLLANKVRQKLDDQRVVTVAIDWLRDHPGRRFVAKVHLYSTHTPYDPPAEYRAMYCDPDYRGRISAFYAEHRVAIEQGLGTLEEGDAEQIANLYYAGVTQADDAIGALLQALEDQGVLDETLVIVTSDHGEELGDHGLWEHNWMYQTNLRVPLVMAWPKGLPAGVRTPALVETIDIVPTVCELLDIAVPDDPTEPDGRGRIDGVSLVPLIRGKVERVKPHAFAENGRHHAILDGRWKLIVSKAVLEDEGGWEASLASARAVERPRLFDLEADPDERVNRIDDALPEAERLLAALRAWSAALPIPVSEVVQSARDIEDARVLMNSLGYTGGVGDL